MRATVLLLSALLASALLLSGCAVSGKDQEKISAACERQIKELSEEPEGNTPTAKTSDEKMKHENLNECAGQVAKAEAATEEGDTTSAQEDASMAEGDKDTGSDKAVALDAAARDLFSSKCGSCHTLADAKTAGTFGPNLDDLAPDQDTVRTQIENGGGGMPPKLLEGDDADKVAEYVANAAGAGS